MSKPMNSILKSDSVSFPYIFEENVDIPLHTFRKGLVRANVYRPHNSGPDHQYPVILTYGPYGKDAPYIKFRKESFDKVHPDHQSIHSAWEVPEPRWWTAHGYAIVRADEEGSGQSPGYLDVFSSATSEAYHDVVEWAASQSWSNGKVGLMGVSYYGASQWFVAARRPKGLAALIIWEGFSDMYRDLVRHGGILSNGFLGASLLHLRGNVEGYAHAGSKLKYLRFVTGRHDLPFYYPESVALQKSFLDAFLKGNDSVGWSLPGRVAPVSIALRESSSTFVPEEREEKGQRREENAWPLPKTQYQNYFLHTDHVMSKDKETKSGDSKTLRWKAIDGSPEGRVSFTTAPFNTTAEFTGHVTAHLNVGLEQDPSINNIPTDIDLFLTIRHLDSDGKEIHYTGPMGEEMAVTKGWLRLSMRKTDPSHPYHRPYLPYRHYRSSDVESIKLGEIYDADIEIWPTNVVVKPGQKLLLEISGADTQGINIFSHDSPVDRPQSKFGGWNILHFDVGQGNYLTLPFIPSS